MSEEYINPLDIFKPPFTVGKEGTTIWFNDKKKAVAQLKWLRRQYIYDTIARMRADRRKKQIQEEIRKL